MSANDTVKSRNSKKERRYKCEVCGEKEKVFVCSILTAQI